MGYNNSPIESLAAFAIAFAAGVLSTAAFSTYVKRAIRRQSWVSGTDFLKV